MIEILAPGPFTTIQDLGRPGLAALGVGASGAVDRRSLRLANRLVGNDEGAAALELTFGGLRARFEALTRVALAGAPCDATAGDRPLAMHAPEWVEPGDELRIGTPAAGVRTYLAVAGGIAVEPVLGSRSTDTLAGLGPARPARGDRLPVGSGSGRDLPVCGERGEAPGGDLPPGDGERGGEAPGGDLPPGDGERGGEAPGGDLPPGDGERGGEAPGGDVAPVPERPSEPVLRLLPGPREDWFSPAAVESLVRDAWTVTPRSDRVGARLDGPPLARACDGELPSEGMVEGALQVPPDGRPVLFLADHPVTGGYPVIAVVAGEDVPLAAQARPGERLRFRR